MLEGLPRRERELLETLVRLGRGTARDMHSQLDNPPSYTAVRTLLSRLEKRGLIEHEVQDQAYMYTPSEPADRTREDALQRLVRTFFQGSPAKAAVALLGEAQPSEQELDELEDLIKQAKRSRPST